MVLRGGNSDDWAPRVAILGAIADDLEASLSEALEAGGYPVSPSLRTSAGWCRWAVLCVQMGDQWSAPMVHAYRELRQAVTQQESMGSWPLRIVVAHAVPSARRAATVFPGSRPPAPGTSLLFTARGWESLKHRTFGDEGWAARELDLFVRAQMRAEEATTREVLDSVRSADHRGGRFVLLSQAMNGARWHGLDALAHVASRYFGEPPRLSSP